MNSQNSPMQKHSAIINDKNIVDKQAAFIRRYAKAEGEGSVGEGNGRTQGSGTVRQGLEAEQQVSFRSLIRQLPNHVFSMAIDSAVDENSDPRNLVAVHNLSEGTRGAMKLGGLPVPSSRNLMRKNQAIITLVK